MAKKAAPKTAPASRKKPARAMEVMTIEPSKFSPSHDDIAKKAFELFQSRGMSDGDDMHDWLSAEAQLRTG